MEFSLTTIPPLPISGNKEPSSLIITLVTPLLSTSQRLSLLAEASEKLLSNERFSIDVVASKLFVFDSGLNTIALLPRHPVASVKLVKDTFETRLPSLRKASKIKEKNVSGSENFETVDIGLLQTK